MILRVLVSIQAVGKHSWNYLLFARKIVAG